MKEALQSWLDQMPPLPGLLGCGICCPDNACLTRSWAPEYESKALEQVVRYAVDALEVLRSLNLPSARLRWLSELVVVYFEQRQDGACLCLLTTHDLWSGEGDSITGLLEQFQSLGGEAGAGAETDS